MGIETGKTFLGKTEALHVSETQSERLITAVRFSVGIVYVVFSLMGLMLGKVGVGAFVVGLTAIGVLFVCSGYYLSLVKNHPAGIITVYALVFLDVTVITVLIGAHSMSGSGSLMLNILFCLYFITITFTAMHYRTGLVLFACGLCIAEYGALTAWYYLYFSSGPSIPRDAVYYLIIEVCILLLVSLVSIVISRNNYQKIKQIVSGEMKYQTLVHRLPEMLFTLSKDGVFIWANLASYTILKIPAKALAGRALRDFMTEPTMLRLSPAGFRGTFEIRDFEDNLKFVDCSVQPIQDPEGKAAWEGIMTDVTDRELAVTQREEMVGRLFQYQKMESLGTLASGMAHDFNHILQTITDISEVVKAHTLEEDTRKHMTQLGETLVDARFLVSELLALGRKTPLDFRPVDLREFFTKITPSFDERPQDKGRFRVTVDLRQDPLVIMADPDYLKRVFQNLAGNARDAMPDGGTITITCFSQQGVSGARIVVIQFADNGTGIPTAVLNRIFDPFFTTKKPGKGTGLGLALVQRIVSLHNGKVTVEKSGRGGTTFRIELPQSDTLTTEDDDTRFILSHRTAARLLLVDDDSKIRDVLKFFLKDFGYDICEAMNMEEGVAELERNKDACNVVIMDWKLGNDDPKRMIQLMRGIKPGIIIIVVSGYPADQKSIKDLNISRWITKPYDKNQLDLEIQKSLHRTGKHNQITG